MRITIIYDNEVYEGQLTAKWGFSCLVEYNGHNLLFDTGGDGSILIENMKKLNIDYKQIDTIFISHGHWDHSGGLAEILRLNEKAILYIPPTVLQLDIKIPPTFIKLAERENLIVVNEAKELYPGIYSTGEQKNIEQSLVIKTEKGLVIIAGCAHQGINKILEEASKIGDIYALIGGFHDFNKYELLKEIELICPTHCTENKSEIFNRYPNKCIKGGAGRVIDICS